ncbi:hypothetical protein LTR84_009678 [Exophiala bonariae]|uniref:Gfo/Idh/MocA-like oxidoreductase N-terminal domain-containing protein n=1 Tax=Exophiala bonariae TaxID=1690606 RepID=A0AAV9NJ42_9EURO|nr:hypothetical protein LTR84_009678 [Exophiala bonariae]
MSSNQIVKVGIIGCGLVTQVVHIPTLGFLSDYFNITFLCDVSPAALEHSAKKVINHVPQTTQDASELCASPNVDVVLLANPDEYHAVHAIEALKHDKHVLIEKPMALCERDADAIIAAEGNSKGKVMIGYMRRYAPAFEDLVNEVGGMEKITYARVRDIIGPNSHFVSQSAMFPKAFIDFSTEAVDDLKSKQDDIINQALAVECGIPVTPEATKAWRFLGGLGSHDLSAMREALGMPQKVVGASLGPIWKYDAPRWLSALKLITFTSVIFEYPGFSVTYETGIDDIPRFDAHVEVYSKQKSVRVCYDTPFVKGLPINLLIRENLDGTYRESIVRKTYEDPYTVEFKKLYDMVVNRKAVKTTAKDAKEDLKIFQMIMKAGVRPGGQ